ncbi:MAG: class I SAM-dependent methyltransferase [Bacteroidota bacterium]
MPSETQNYSAEDFYDSLVEDYHLIFADWDWSIKRQAEGLDKLIKSYARAEAKTVWDCSCGIGTQALGLAAKGYQVVGTDLSGRAIQRAQAEAAQRRLDVSFAKADLRIMAQIPLQQFDVIISCDNSLPHLLEMSELIFALKKLKSSMKPEGIVLGSMRDYDQIAQEQANATSPRSKIVGEEEIISFQTWQWSSPSIYQVKHFIIRGQGDRFHTKVRLATYRAYRRKEMNEAFRAAGFAEIEWLFPEESGYYQPVFVLR